MTRRRSGVRFPHGPPTKPQVRGHNLGTRRSRRTVVVTEKSQTGERAGYGRGMASRSSVPVPRRDPKRGTWMFAFDSVRPHPDGRRRQIRRRGFATRKEAADELRRLMEEDRKLAGTEAVTVGQLVDDLLAQKRRKARVRGAASGEGLARSTLAFNHWAANIVKDRFGDTPADELTYEDLDRFYDDMLDGSYGKRVFKRNEGVVQTDRPYSTRSVAGVHDTIRSAYSLAVIRGKVLRNPADLATPPPVSMKRSWWTPEQVAQFLRFIAQADRDGSNPLPLGLVETLVDTGGRRGETVAVRWCDIDFDRGSLKVTRQFYRGEYGPTKRERDKSIISLADATLDVLKRRREVQAVHRSKMGVDWPGPDHPDHDLVFTWPDGTMLDPLYVTRAIGKLSERAGLPRLTPHGLRHSFATAALAAGVPVEVVAQRLGNTVRIVQQVYAHAIPAGDAEAARTVAALFRPDS